MSTAHYQQYFKDARISTRQGAIWQPYANQFAFRETGNTFLRFVAEPYSSHVLLATDRATMLELSQHYEIDTSCDAMPAGIVNADLSGRILMGVFDGSKGTLVHEIGHATFRVLHRAGVKSSAEDDEAFCYLQGKMFEAFERYI